MKSLRRMLFLDSRQTPNPSVLPNYLRPDGRTTRDYILQDLITVDGGPGRDTYYLWGCGDNEKDTGTAQDREDENGDSGSCGFPGFTLKVPEPVSVILGPSSALLRVLRLIRNVENRDGRLHTIEKIHEAFGRRDSF